MIEAITNLWNSYLANQYLEAAAILLLTFISVKIVLFIISRVLPQLTKKIPGKWDDELLERATGPLTWIAMFAGVRIIIGQITLGETFNVTATGIVDTIMIIFAGILVYHIIFAVIGMGLTQLGKRTNKGINESIIQFFSSIIKFLIVVVIFLTILASWGIEIGPLLAGLGVAGLAIAFALQNTLSNIFGGISLLLDRSINVGDLVNLEDGTAGTVMRIGLRSTQINTFDNELVIVPNGKLSEENIKNVALPEPKARVVVPFGVEYGTHIAKVKKIVLEQIKKIKHYQKHPEPSVKFLEMADSSLNFKAYFYVDSYEHRIGALDEANTKIYNALNKEGIGIPFPQMDVNIKEQPTAKKATLTKKKK